VSRREQEVLDALRERLTNAEIAERLFMSVRTVATHVSSLLRKAAPVCGDGGEQTGVRSMIHPDCTR
jgi:FixJ family two-component response regulator